MSPADAARVAREWAAESISMSVVQERLIERCRLQPAQL